MLTLAGCLAVDIFFPTGWVATEVWEEGDNSEKENKAGDTSLLTVFAWLLVEEGSIDMELSVLVSLKFVETEAFSRKFGLGIR